MIRLLGWLIRFCLSAVLVVVGILFFWAIFVEGRR
jgi:hypothetical protein